MDVRGFVRRGERYPLIFFSYYSSLSSSKPFFWYDEKIEMKKNR